MSKNETGFSLTASQMSLLNGAQEQREANEAMNGLKVLAAYDSSEIMNEKLTYQQSILVALAYNKPELLEGYSLVDTAADAFSRLDRASREMLHVWIASRDRILIDIQKENEGVESK